MIAFLGNSNGNGNVTKIMVMVIGLFGSQR